MYHHFTQMVHVLLMIHVVYVWHIRTQKVNLKHLTSQMIYLQYLQKQIVYVRFTIQYMYLPSPVTWYTWSKIESINLNTLAFTRLWCIPMLSKVRYTGHWLLVRCEFPEKRMFKNITPFVHKSLSYSPYFLRYKAKFLRMVKWYFAECKHVTVMKRKIATMFTFSSLYTLKCFVSI